MAGPAEQELPPGQGTPPWMGDTAEITRSQLEQLRLRASREDYKRLISALIQFDTIMVVDDAAPEPT